MNTKINKSFKSKVITLISAALVISFFAIPTVGILSSRMKLLSLKIVKCMNFQNFLLRKKLISHS